MVIVLDTNVFSEAMKAERADRAVMAWLRGLEEKPWLTVMTRAETMAGIALLPVGKRREVLAVKMDEAAAEYAGILEFTDDCALAYGMVVAARTRLGRPITAPDAVIAAIVLRRGATLATRNTKDFEGLGMDLVNPWEATPAGGA